MLPLGEAERAVGEVFCGEPLAGEGLGTFKALSSSLTPSLTPGEKEKSAHRMGNILISRCGAPEFVGGSV